MVFIQARNYCEQKCGRNASLKGQSKLITPPIILMHPDILRDLRGKSFSEDAAVGACLSIGRFFTNS
jgi:hypothetical protein